MSLKLIPFERTAGDGKQKHFNPGNAMKKSRPDGKSPNPFKNLCLRLIRFINRGSRFTYEQIDELIVSLHRTILNLQKKKQEMLKKKFKS